MLQWHRCEMARVCSEHGTIESSKSEWNENRYNSRNCFAIGGVLEIISCKPAAHWFCHGNYWISFVSLLSPIYQRTSQTCASVRIEVRNLVRVRISSVLMPQFSSLMQKSAKMRQLKWQKQSDEKHVGSLNSISQSIFSRSFPHYASEGYFRNGRYPQSGNLVAILLDFLW